MNDAPAPHTRYHAFDALRAVMMLLGVVLHSCQYYLTFALYPGLDFRDEHTSAACDVAFLGIHSFRMQVFFVMSGFFAALLCERRGPRGMWGNRWKRVGLPLIAGWLILFPLTISAFLYACARKAGAPGWETVANWWQTGRISWVEGWQPVYSLFLVSPWQLWFLYALLWLCALGLAFRWLGNRFGGAPARGANRLFRGLASWHLLLPAAVLASTLAILPNPSGMFAQEFPLFIPNPLVFLAFGPFFAFGWLLHRNIDLLPRIGRRPLLLLAAAAAVLVYYLGLLGSAFNAQGANTRLLETALTGSTLAWLCVFGFIGLFLRHFDRPSRTMRYLSDSAYWVYLAHLPLVYGTHGLLFDLPAPALVKVAILLAVVTPILYVSYDLVVRPGRIGRFLNGRTEPSALLAWWGRPRAEEAEALTLEAGRSA